MVHTLIHKYLIDYEVDMGLIRYYEGYLPNVCEMASHREQEAQNAEREVLDMKMAEYMEDHIGEEYVGVISGVNTFGFFVELPNLIEGLVHISTLNGFYNYVPELLSLTSQNSIKYTLGDTVRVKVTGASKEMRTIDFEVLEVLDGNKK